MARLILRLFIARVNRLEGAGHRMGTCNLVVHPEPEKFRFLRSLKKFLQGLIPYNPIEIFQIGLNSFNSIHDNPRTILRQSKICSSLYSKGIDALFAHHLKKRFANTLRIVVPGSVLFKKGAPGL